MAEKRSFFFLYLTAAMVTWGLSWASGKYISDQAPPEALLFWRFTFTFVSLIPVVLVVEKSFKVSFSAIISLVAGGVIMGAYNYLFFQGLEKGFAGAGGVLVTTMNPIVTFALASVLFRNMPKRREILGLLLGVAGGAFMLRVWDISFDHLIDGGNLFFLGASFAWAIMTIITQLAAPLVSPFRFSFYVHLIAAGVSLLLGLVKGVSFLDLHPISFWGNIVYLSVVATTFGTTVYFIASRNLGAKVASSFIFIVPVTALFSGVYFLRETPELSLLIGGALALFAVYFINFSGKKRTKTTP